MRLAKKISMAFSGFVLIASPMSRGDAVPFSPHLISPSAMGANSVFAIDLDGDLDIDVLSASENDDKIAWYENNGGSPPIFLGHVISTLADAARSVYAADVDGDDNVDVLSASTDDDKIAWYESDGGMPPTFTERVISTNANGASSVFAIDIDGDLDTDVVSASFFDDKIAWYENLGGVPPNFVEHVITNFANGAFSVFAIDLDGDLDTDVLSASFEDDRIAWYENDGNMPPNFTLRNITLAADGARSIYAIDINGDSDLDVVSLSEINNTIAWYQSNGGMPPLFNTQVASIAVFGGLSVFAEDVDGDENVDLLTASWTDDTIAWYESDGSLVPSFTKHVISNSADFASSVFAIDVDGDGDTDVLSASRFDHRIMWYENLTAIGPVPAASQWGLIALTHLLLVGGTLVFRRRRIQHS